MEAKALKSSFWESSTTEHESLEETWSLNAANVVSGEDFKIDEFFNFSNGGLESPGEEDDDKEEGKKVFVSNQSSGSLTVDGSNSFLSVELAIPGDALADLEWVSHFVDDSCSEFSFFCPAEKSDSEPETFRSEPERQLPGMEISCFPAAFPVRPRTKRPRQTRPSKTLGSSPPSSSSSSTSSGIFPAPYFIFTDTDDSFNGSSEPPKKQRKIATHHGGSVSTVQFQRRCSHCLVQKTPQWRTGPHGAKTLCNACGVRYKSGRLFPEYRPALSPTFCSEIHSNSHRKVLEMRRVKDIEKPASGLTQMIPSY